MCYQLPFTGIILGICLKSLNLYHVIKDINPLWSQVFEGDIQPTITPTCVIRFALSHHPL